MKYLALIPLFFAMPAWGQDAQEDEWIYLTHERVEEFFVDGIYDDSTRLRDIAASIDVLTDENLENISLVHPAEALNGIAGVNIHRGSGQEHLTAIRSPVLTGGAGAGSFLYLEDGVPLRAAGFANVNGLFEAGTEFANKLEVFKGPGPVFYGSNAVHGLINVQSRDVGGPNSFRVLGSDDGLAKSYRSQARLERDLGDKTLALTPYVRRVELRFLRHFVPGQALEKNSHTSVGLQSALFTQDWNIGLDVEYTKGKLFEFQDNETVFSFTQGLHYDYEVDSFVGAAYAQKDFYLGERTVLDIGARAEYTRYDYDNQTTDGRSGRFIRLADRTDDFFVITPKASLRHEVNENLNIYARAARGARAPQTVDLYSVQLNQTGGEAEVETLDSLELGVKFGGETFTFEAAAFAQWKDNFFFRNSDGFSVANGKTNHIVASCRELFYQSW